MSARVYRETPQAPAHNQHPYYEEWINQQCTRRKHDDACTRIAELSQATLRERAGVITTLPIGAGNVLRRMR